MQDYGRQPRVDDGYTHITAASKTRQLSKCTKSKKIDKKGGHEPTKRRKKSDATKVSFG